VHEQLKAALTALDRKLATAGLNVVLLNKRAFEEIQVLLIVQQDQRSELRFAHH
jgi:hypothetical protein